MDEPQSPEPENPPTLQKPPLLDKVPPVETGIRHFGGWFALLVFFGYVLYSATTTSLSHRPDKVETVAEAERYLSRAVDSRQQHSSGERKAHTDLVIATKVIELKKFEMKDTARALVAMEAEAKMPISERAVRILTKDGDAVDHSILNIYTGPVHGRNLLVLLKPLDSEPVLKRAATVYAYEKAGFKPPYVGVSNSKSRGIGLAFIAVTLMAGGLAWLVVFPALTSGALKPKGLQLQAATKLEADRLAIYAALVFGFLQIGQLVAYALAVAFGGGRLTAAMTSLFCIPFIALALRCKVFGRHMSLAEFGPSPGVGAKQLFQGAIGFLCEWPISMGILTATSMLSKYLPKAEHPLTTALAADHSFGMILFGLVTAAVLAPISEEIIFRGLLFPAFAKLTGKVWVGALLSSLLFASLHPQGVSAWMALASIGGASCMLSYYTKSLAPSIILHALDNTTILIISVLLS